MSYKPGEVIDIKESEMVLYYDGFTKRKVDVEVLHLFIGEQFQEMKDLVGHCIQVYKDRSGRINEIQVLD
jgi:hypothetical protein